MNEQPLDSGDPSSPADGEPTEVLADRGLAAERTDIAWSRTTLALVTCAATVVRRVPQIPRASIVALSISVIVTLAAASLLLRQRLATHERDPTVDFTRLRLRNVAVMTSLTGALCLVVMFFTMS